MRAVRAAMHFAEGAFVSEGRAGSAQAGSFAVELPVFTGPFRLLADLILEQKVDVCDVRIADVTDDYLEHGRRTGGGVEPRGSHLVPGDLCGAARTEGGTR